MSNGITFHRTTPHHTLSTILCIWYTIIVRMFNVLYTRNIYNILYNIGEVFSCGAATAVAVVSTLH